MQKCRLCLKNSKNVKCIFDTFNKKGTSYAEIINSVANVKIFRCDGMTDQICLSCRRKSTEFWDFKHQVERSHITLQERCPMKKIYFTNIHDIKLNNVTDENFKKPISLAFTKNLIKNDDEPFNYNETVIKKVSNDEKHLSVIEFLNSIKDENENDYQDDCSYKVELDCDPDYKVELDCDPDYKVQQSSKKNKKKTKKDKENNQDVTILQSPIKPVFLADYSLVPTRNPRKVPLKQKAKDNLLICPYCGKMTKSLKIHLLTHSEDKPFKCEQCSSAFTLMRQLDNHIKQAHGSKVIKCDLCVAMFTTKYRLNRHMKSRHCTEKRHTCTVCNKAFKMKTHLARHVQTVHNFGLKAFKCELCPDTFSASSSLKHHRRVHTGERPYNCEICSQPYSYKHDFNRHCLKKHGVCFKRRTISVLNEEVLAQERVLMRDLMLRVNGILKDDKPVNPFDGPQAAMAYDQMIKAIESGKVVVDLQL